MSTLDDSQTSCLWGELELDAPLSTKFSDVINDDFLIVDGLHQDISGMLNIDADIFSDSKFDFSFELPTEDAKDTVSNDTIENPNDNSVSADVVKSDAYEQEIHHEEKAKKSREDRSRSPTPKRRRSMNASSPMDISPHPVKSIVSPSTDTLDDLQRQYKLAVEQLAVSMRRSEMTRSEIIVQRKAAETRAQLQKAQDAQYSNADIFLSGSRSTLTVGLEQSRQMLRNYMGSLKSPQL